MNPRIVLITNIPAPYREPIHEQVAAHFNQNYTVIYCQEKEPNRQWRLGERKYPFITLKSRMLKYRGRFIHLNVDVLTQLHKLDPAIVITTGFNPTMLLAFVWAKLHGRQHIAMTDGWLGSEAALSPLHRLVRKVVYRFSSAFIGASQHSLDLYRVYGCKEVALFQSHLCANNAEFAKHRHDGKQFDLMFSGQLVEGKLPLFFVEVAEKIRRSRGSCRVLVLGSGALQDVMMRALSDANIELTYPGFVDQSALPAFYASARLFLFPTLQEAWGVVANEACAAGVPVITCVQAGAANDLVRNNINGYILPLESDVWAEHCIKLLDDDSLYCQFSEAAFTAVQEFSYKNAAQGVIDAINFVREIR